MSAIIVNGNFCYVFSRWTSDCNHYQTWDWCQFNKSANEKEEALSKIEIDMSKQYNEHDIVWVIYYGKRYWYKIIDIIEYLDLKVIDKKLLLIKI